MISERRYLAAALLYGLIVEMGIGRIPTNINTLSLIRHLKTLLAQNPALHNLYDWNGGRVPLSVGTLLFASGLFLTLAALSLRNTIKPWRCRSDCPQGGL